MPFLYVFPSTPGNSVHGQVAARWRLPEDFAPRIRPRIDCSGVALVLPIRSLGGLNRCKTFEQMEEVFCARTGAHAARPESRGIVRCAIFLGLGLAIAMVVVPSFAETPEFSAESAYWQDQYRILMAEAQRLREKG